MPKLKLLLLGCLLILLKDTEGQSYPVQYVIKDGDSSVKDDIGLKEKFNSQSEARYFITTIPTLLQIKGYITGSVDSSEIDSSGASVHLFLGLQYKWAKINTLPKDEDILSAVRWPKSSFKNSGMDWNAVKNWQEQILTYLENNGYPFAKIVLDSITIQENQVEALLKIDRGYLYKLDSIRLWGNAKISKEFLQRYLELPDGSIFNKQKILDASKKIRQITYVEEEQPSSISFQATGSALNLYLKAKKNSQVNLLVGFLPNSNAGEGKKFLITGEANILLRNALGAGETIGLNWQQLQIKSPRLNILYDHPFLFKSPLGLNYTMDMFRKDSTFLNINMQLGANYIVSGSQSAMVFVQRRQSILNGIDTFRIKQMKRLPAEADVSSTNLGVSYNFNTTDYRFNPHKGNELMITVAAGKKKIKKNNQVLELKDPAFDYNQLYDTVKLNTYQFRFNGSAAHYFPVTKQTALKTGINAGFLQSGNYFLNELFQIGGYKLLRGFTEESEYVSQYIIGTLEYRYLIGVNSNFFVFVDGGWAKNPVQLVSNHTYLGTGLGMAFETKAGIFNLAWAIGKRNDSELNLRQSKLHFGFVNYF
jgi:outer membrane protein assembly factor BamA